MKRTQRTVSVPDLIRRMIEAGASFHLSAGGTWRVDGLASLPCYLQDAFFACDEKQLVAHLRQMSAVAEKVKRPNGVQWP